MRFIGYILLFALYCKGILWDASRHVALNMKFSELSFTEFSQSVLLAVSVVILLLARKRYRYLAVGQLILAMFLLICLIRENDAWLDHIWHGFWAYPSALIGIATLFYFVKNRKSLIQELCLFMGTRAFALLVAGFLTVYVYSRLFGRSLLWESALGHQYVRIAKNMGEECSESLGYLLILCACIEVYVLVRKLYLAKASAT